MTTRISHGVTVSFAAILALAAGAVAHARTDLVYEDAGIPDSIAALARDRFGCEYPGAIEAFGAGITTIGEGKAFYVVPCFTGDVNIESFVVLLDEADPANPTVVEFELPPGFNEPDRATVINPSFDFDTSTFSVVSYSSPDADCGVYELHRYDREYGYLELQEYREKQDCDGQATPPEQYPLVWTVDEMGN